MSLDLPFSFINLKYNPMRNSVNTNGVNPLYNNKRGAEAGADMSCNDYKQSEVRADGTGSNHSLPTDGPLRQNIEDSTKLTDNDNTSEDDDFTEDFDADDDVEDPGVISSGNLPGDDEEGDEDELFDDDFEVDGDSDDLNADIDDDDLDTLDGPLLDENNPRH